jgi:3-ketosteroid 9alpha-monooxygenase subunit A
VAHAPHDGPDVSSAAQEEEDGMSSTAEDVRSIEGGPPPQRFARGWHCLGLAEQYKDGQPHAVQAFGQQLVIWQGENGQLNVLDSFCRHMGADLSRGTVKGDEIACPFHDWRWNGDGRCKQVPYARRVPPGARTAAWPTLEQDGLLHVYNDPEGNPPPDEVAIPRIAGATDDGWTDWLWYSIEVDANCREVIDNVVDMAHFFYVHYSFPTYFKNVFEGHVATQYMNGLAREDVTPPSKDGNPQIIGNESVASYYGPSFMIDELTYKYDGFDIESVLINCHYPITPDKFVLQYGVIVEKSDLLDADAAEMVAKKMGKFIAMGFEQDVEIWKHKARIDNPLLSREDGPIYQLRRWYEQFYVDVDDVTPEMTNRFEFEMDTTKPVEAWRQEVEENLARREAGDPQTV